jgi:hypothetical protein
LGLIAAVFGVSSLFGGLLPASASAASLASGMTPAQEATSYSYYVAFGGCIENTMHADFNTTVAGDGNSTPSEWFDTGLAWLGHDHFGYVYPGGAKVECQDIASQALALWGWTGSTQTFLSAMGYSFQANVSTGSPSYHGTGDGVARRVNFQKAVQKQVYDSQAPTLSAAAQYDIDLGAFAQNGGTCKAQDLGVYPSLGGNALYKKYVDANTSQDAATSDNAIFSSSTGTLTYTHLSVTGSVTGVKVDHGYAYISSTTSFISGGNGSTTVDTNQTSAILYGYPPVTRATCLDLVTSINKNAGLYSTWVIQHSTQRDEGVKSPVTCTSGAAVDPVTGKACVSTSTCGSQVSGVGWIVCPVIGALTNLNDAMWGLVSGLLTIDPLKDGGTIFTAWGTIRSVANALFVVAFLIIIFAQLSSVGITNYGVKKMLPRLIVSAILVNLSFYVVAIGVDLANIIGSSTYHLIAGLAPPLDPAKAGWGALVNLITQGALVGGLSVAGIALAGGAQAALLLVLPLAAIGALGLLAAVVTLIFRQAALPVLAILAPLAFVAYLFPNTESWFKKWRDMLLSMLMLFPLAAVVFGGVQFAALTIIGDGTDWWRMLIGLVMLTLPLFSLPFLARQGGPMLSKVSGAMSGLVSRAGKPLNEAGKSMAAPARAKYLSSTPRRWNLGQRARQGLIRAGQRRDLKAAGYKADSDAAFNNDLAANAETIAQGLGTAGQAHVRAVVTRAQAEEVKLAMDSMKLEAGFNPSDRSALARELGSAILGNNHTRAAAVTNYLVAARGVDELHSTLGAAQAAGRMSADMSTAMQRVMTSAENGGVIKERRPDLTAWGAQGGSIAGISAKPGTWSVSAEDAAGLSIGAMNDALATGGMPADIANRVLDTPQLRARLDTAKEAVMQQIAGRAGGGTTTSQSIGAVGSESIVVPAASAPAPPTPKRGSFTDGQGRPTPTDASDDYHEGMSK